MNANLHVLFVASSGGWLSRIWKRSDSTGPAPVKANLGEESSFYYDKEQKRWVNKNVRDLADTSISFGIDLTI